MNELIQRHCQACEGGVSPLNKAEIDKYHPKIPNWEISPDLKMIKREFLFKNFYETMAFVNAIAWLAHQDNHHPDLEIGYNYCRVTYTTHAIMGLSENDIICAAKIDNILL